MKGTMYDRDDVKMIDFFEDEFDNWYSGLTEDDKIEFLEKFYNASNGEFHNGDEIEFKNGEVWESAYYVGVHPNSHNMPYRTHVALTNTKKVNSLTFCGEIRHKLKSFWVVNGAWVKVRIDDVEDYEDSDAKPYEKFRGTKEECKEYIRMNRPRYSLKEVEKAVKHWGFAESLSVDKIEEFLKREE